MSSKGAVSKGAASTGRMRRRRDGGGPRASIDAAMDAVMRELDAKVAALTSVRTNLVELNAAVGAAAEAGGQEGKG